MSIIGLTLIAGLILVPPSAASLQVSELLRSHLHVAANGQILDDNSDRQRVVVVDAKLSPSSSAKAEVELTLDATPMRDGQSRALEHVLVSIQNTERIVVGTPLYRVIEFLQPGTRVTVRFKTTENLRDVIIEAIHGGFRDTYGVRIRTAGAAAPLSITVQQPSLTADLGRTAIFRFSLSRKSSDLQTVKLQVNDLPGSFTWDFLFADSQEDSARFSEYRFADGEFNRPLLLRIRLPDEIKHPLKVNKPISFRLSCNAVSDGGVSHAADSQLTLLPQGVGKLEMSLQNYFLEVSQVLPIDLSVSLKNAGSNAISDIALESTLPTGWKTEFLPRDDTALQPGETKDVRVRIIPSSREKDGEFQVGLSGSGKGVSTDAADPSVTLRVRISPLRSYWTPLAFLSSAAFLLGAVVYVGVKLAKH